METLESLDTINRRLRDYYGVAWNNFSIWRISWSENQIEKRFGTYTDYSSEGIYLRTVTEWREVPKYRQWIQDKWVLERLTVVPDVNRDELGEKISYEPIYVFEDQRGFPLPYKWEAAQFVIDTLNAAAGKSNMAKYVDNDPNTEEVIENRVNKLQEELFGNETQITDALSQQRGIVVPSNYKREN